MKTEPVTNPIVSDPTKDLAYFEALPYEVSIRRDSDGDFVARIPDLPGCIAHGKNEASAIRNLRAVQRLWIEEALSAGLAIREPENEMPSGKWVQRVPRRLHKELAAAARRENVSLNQLVTSMLSEALGVGNCVRALEAILDRRSEGRPRTAASAKSPRQLRHSR
jgi:predicted RNase H-like HicB family nuclease